jgi:hypothetical protein
LEGKDEKTLSKRISTKNNENSKKNSMKECAIDETLKITKKILYFQH